MFVVIANDINFRKDWAVPFFEFVSSLSLLKNSVYDTNFVDKDDLYSYFIEIYNKIPDIVIGYEFYNYDIIKKLKDIKVKVVVITEDLHHCDLSNPLNSFYMKTFTQVDKILCRFNVFAQLYNIKMSNIVDSYLYCSKYFIRDEINNNPENKIFMYGSINYIHPSTNTNQYHFRGKYHDLLSKKYKNKFVYHTEKLNGEDGMINTSNALHNYICAFTCGYHPVNYKDFDKNDRKYYFIGKFFEIAGSGVLLIADTTGIKDDMINAGFIDGYNYIDVTFETLYEKCNWILNKNNKATILKIRKNGLELIKSRHLLPHRINHIQSELDKMIDCI